MHFANRGIEPGDDVRFSREDLQAIVTLLIAAKNKRVAIGSPPSTDVSSGTGSPATCALMFRTSHFYADPL